MGDHFVFLVDRLLTESTLKAAIESGQRLYPVNETVIDCSSSGDVVDDDNNCIKSDVFGTRKMVECRICQDEDYDSNMESPCSCCGSLKYAHRKCVQRWCNQKGNIICEICHQKFKPGYTTPPSVFWLGGIPSNFRGHWQISRRDMSNTPRMITVASSNHDFLAQEEYDQYSDSTVRSILCFRAVAFIFMILLILRHTLPIFANGVGDYSLPVLLLLLVRTCGIIVPIYIIIRAASVMIHRRHQLASSASTSSLSSSDEEAGPRPMQHQPHIGHVN